MDATRLPGTVTLVLFGHEIEPVAVDSTLDEKDYNPAVISNVEVRPLRTTFTLTEVYSGIWYSGQRSSSNSSDSRRRCWGTNDQRAAAVPLQRLRSGEEIRLENHVRCGHGADFGRAA